MGFSTNKMHKVQNIMRHKCHINHILKTKADFKHLNYWALNVECNLLVWFMFVFWSATQSKIRGVRCPPTAEEREGDLQNAQERAFPALQVNPPAKCLLCCWELNYTQKQSIEIPLELSCPSQGKWEDAPKDKIVLEKTFSCALRVASSFASTATCASLPFPSSLASPQGSGRFQYCFQATALGNCN